MENKNQVINRKSKTFVNFDGKTEKYYNQSDLEFLRALTKEADIKWMHLVNEEDSYSNTFFSGQEKIQIYYLKPRERIVKIRTLYRFLTPKQQWIKSSITKDIVKYLNDNGIECWYSYELYN